MNSNDIVTKQDLINFRQELLTAINNLVPNSQTTQKRILRSKEVRKMLNISAGTLQHLRIKGTLSYSKLNGTIFYEYDDVIKALNDNKSN